MTSCISLGSKKEPPIHWFTFEVMVSAKDNCKRALVTLLKTFATLYGCSVELTRNSTDTDVRKAYRAVSRNVHPDRGGNTEDQKRLNVTYGDWCNANSVKPKPKGKTKKGESGVVAVVAPAAGLEKTFWFSFLLLRGSPSFSFFLLSPSFFFFLLHCLGLGSGL